MTDSTTDTTTIQLLYFNLRARGEVLKYLLNHSRLPWQDKLISGEDWVSGQFDKASIPAGRSGQKQLPVLVVPPSLLLAGNTDDDAPNSSMMMIAESVDIAKWISRQCEDSTSLLGSTPDIAAKAERIFLYVDEPIEDIRGSRLGELNPLLNFYSVEQSATRIPTYLEHCLPRHLEYLSSSIGDVGPYICGTELTYVDFMVFHYLDNACTLFGEDNVLEKMTIKHCQNPSNLRVFYDEMYRLPAISRHMMDRPLAGHGSVGRPNSIIFTTKVPSKLDFIQQALKDYAGIDISDSSMPSKI